MTPHEKMRMELEFFSELAAANLKIEARTDALREAVAAIRAESEGVSRESVLLELIESERVAHQRLLEEFEKKNPALAALLDKRQAEDLPEQG